MPMRLHQHRAHALMAALAAVGYAAGARAQEPPLAAAPSAPGLRSEQRVTATAIPRPGLAELLTRGGITQAVIDRRRADPAETPLAATTPAGSALAPRAKVAAPPRPTADQLLQRIRALPGGAAQLDQVQRGRAGSPGAPTTPPDDAMLGAERIGGPFVADAGERNATAGPVWATPDKGYNVVAATGGSLGIQLDSAQSVITYAEVTEAWHLYSISDETHRPIVRFRVQVPTTGWYVLDVEASSTPYARLRTLVEGRMLGITTAWSGYANDPNPSLNFLSGWRPTSYPVLVNLAAGVHVFEWFLTAPPGVVMSTWMFGVTVTQI